MPLVAMPFVTSSFLFLVVRPGAPSSVLCSVRSDALCSLRPLFGTELEGRRSPVRSSRRAGEGGTGGGAGTPSSSTVISMAIG